MRKVDDISLYRFFAKASMPTRVPSLSEKEIKEANASVKKLQEENVAGRSASTPGVTGQNFPLEIFSGGENILRTNSPPRVDFLGKYLPL